MLLDEKREPLHTLDPGQRKGIQNQRVTLVEGDETQKAVIQRIFHEFVELRYSEHKIAERLNTDGILSPGGRRWAAGMVLSRLRNETYAGTLLYNRTSQKLKTRKHHNPPEDWVRTAEAFDGIVSHDHFAQAQDILEERRRRYEPDRMLGHLSQVYKEYGIYRSSLLRLHEDAPQASAYARTFGSWDLAFQRMYGTQRDRARDIVHEQICNHVPDVLSYSDFLVLDRKLAISVQPAMPIPSGYEAYWPILPDARHVIDITLGVLLSDPEEMEILGYVALPRWLSGNNTVRIGAASTRVELFGCCDLGFLQHLLQSRTHHG